MLNSTNLCDAPFDAETENDEMAPINLFVYGTLKSEVDNSEARTNRFHNFLEEFAHTKQDAMLSKFAVFFDVRGGGRSLFPAATYKEHPALKDMEPVEIHGELYEVPTYMLTLLANVEGVLFDETTDEVYVLDEGGEGSEDDMKTAIVYMASDYLLTQLEPQEIREISNGCY